MVVILVLSWFFDKYLTWTWFPEAIVAFGTLFLAAATFKLAETTIQENNKLRDDNERIKKKEQQSDAILRLRQWTEKSLKIYNSMHPIMDALHKSAWEQDPTNIRILNPWPLRQIWNNFDQIKTESFGARADANIIGKNELELTNNVAEKIEVLSDTYFGLLDPPPKFDIIDKQQEDIIKALNEILKTIASE